MSSPPSPSEQSSRRRSRSVRPPFLHPHLRSQLTTRAELREFDPERSPDLIVEIILPSTAEWDRGLKLERYRLFGVGEYWVVDPSARSVEVWDLAVGMSVPYDLPGMRLPGNGSRFTS